MVDKVGALMRRPINGYGVLVLLVVCLSLAGLGIASARGEGRRTADVVCSLVAEAAGTEARKLTEYDREPPATEAGRAQRRAVEESLQQWRDQGARLGCSPGKE